MEFFVNDRCIGCGLCPNACPEVFHMTDAGVAEAARQPKENEVLQRAKEAQEACPVEAIETKH